MGTPAWTVIRETNKLFLNLYIFALPVRAAGLPFLDVAKPLERRFIVIYASPTAQYEQPMQKPSPHAVRAVHKEVWSARQPQHVWGKGADGLTPRSPWEDRMLRGLQWTKENAIAPTTTPESSLNLGRTQMAVRPQHTALG